MTDHRARAVALLGHVTIDTAAIVHALLHLADTSTTRDVDLTAPTEPREDDR